MRLDDTSSQAEPPGDSVAGGARHFALRALQANGVEPHAEIVNVARVSMAICAMPLSLFAVIGIEEEWVASCPEIGPLDTESARPFRLHALAADQCLEVCDLTIDPRFAKNPLVAGPPSLRYFAGFPLVSEGVPFGMIGVFDVVPRSLSLQQREAMIAHTHGIVTVIRHRRAARELLVVEAARARMERDLFVASTAIAHASDPILILTKPAGTSHSPTIRFANDAWDRLVGGPQQSTVGQRVTGVANLAHHAEIFDEVATLVADGDRLRRDLRIEHTDGTLVEVEMTATSLPPADGDLRWVAVLRDLRDQRAAERAERDVAIAQIANDALAASEGRLRTLFASTPAIAFTLDRDLVYRSSLGGGLTKIGTEPDEAIGRPLHYFLPRHESEPLHEYYVRALEGQTVSYEAVLGGRSYHTFLQPLAGAQGHPDGVAGISFDLTDHYATQTALAASERHLARTERTAQVGSWLHDIVEDRRTYSGELRRIFGVTDPDADRDAFLAKIVPADRERVRTSLDEAYALAESVMIEYRLATTAGSRWVRETLEFTRERSGRLTKVDGIVVDITKRRRAEMEIERIADTDETTGLPNRTALLGRLARATRETTRDGGHAPVLVLVEIDQFRAIKDTFGHVIGDRLLRASADRIAGAVQGAFLARLDGDSFALLPPPGSEPDGFGAVLHRAFLEPFLFGEARISATISIGYAERRPEDTIDLLLRNVETALSAAKAAGGRLSVGFEDEIARVHRRRLQLDLDIRGATERGEFRLHFQPIVSLGGDSRSGLRPAVSRFEALVRWQHPVFGELSPAEFIPIAEMNGEILPIGRWVLNVACTHLRTLRDAARAPLRVCVNVSARQFAGAAGGHGSAHDDADLLAAIRAALAGSDLPASALELEITESMIARDPVRAARLLGTIRAEGVTVSIDDFGTGFSSLASLQRLPIDTLKIDRSFIAGVPFDLDANAIVEAVLALAHQMALEVIAEGVETLEQAEFLRSRGCTFQQGYYFAHPAPPGAMRLLLDQQTVRGESR